MNTSRVDWAAVKADFPVLQRMIDGQRLVYLDSANTSQKPNAVIDAMADFMRNGYAPINRSAYRMAGEATDLYEGARSKVQRFINARSVNEVVFTKNATESINLIAQSRVTQWLGAISYPLYLWHWPVLVIPAIYMGSDLNFVQTALLLGLTVLLAGLTHRYVETPMRNATMSNRRVLRLATAATILSIVLGLTTYTQYSNNISIGGGTTYSLDQIRSKPINNNDGCHIHIRQTVSPRCEYGDISSKKTIVLSLISSLNLFQSPPASRAIAANSPWNAGIVGVRGRSGAFTTTGLVAAASAASESDAEGSIVGRSCGTSHLDATSAISFSYSARLAGSLSGTQLPLAFVLDG